MSEDTEIAVAQEVVRMASSEGWLEIRKWINSRIEILTNKIANNESDITIGNVETKTEKSRCKKTEITVVNVFKDAERHELMTWKMLLRKVSDFEEIAMKGRK